MRIHQISSPTPTNGKTLSLNPTTCPLKSHLTRMAQIGMIISTGTQTGSTVPNTRQGHSIRHDIHSRFHDDVLRIPCLHNTTHISSSGSCEFKVRMVCFAGIWTACASGGVL